MFWNICEIFVKYFDILWCGWSGGNHLRLRQIPLLWSFCCCCYTFFHTASTSAKITTRFGKSKTSCASSGYFCWFKFWAQCVHTVSRNGPVCLVCLAQDTIFRGKPEKRGWSFPQKQPVKKHSNLFKISLHPPNVLTLLIIYRALTALCRYGSKKKELSKIFIWRLSAAAGIYGLLLFYTVWYFATWCWHRS